MSTPRKNLVGVSWLLMLLSFFTFTSMASSDAIDYFYDDVGQLTRAVKNSNGIVYHYDESGNPISVGTEAVGTNPPSIQSINPNVLFIGAKTYVAIVGQNLFTAANVSSSNPYLNISILTATNTHINVLISVSSGASPGETALTATTSYGSATATVSLAASTLQFVPDRLILAPGGSGSVTASIVPSINQSQTAMIYNSNPSIVSAPDSVTIPANGTTAFTVNALTDGTATISLGGSSIDVIVTDSFSNLPGEQTTSSAHPVSVSINNPTALPSTIESVPVSASIDSSPGESTVVAGLVSVQIAQ